MSENRGCCRKLFWVFAYSATMLRWSENTGPHDQVWVGVCSGDLGQRQADSQRPICKRGLMVISDHTCSLPLVACHTVCDVFTYADWGCSHLHKCPLFSRDCSHSRRWWFPLSFCLFPMILMAWKGSESLKKKKKGILDRSSQRTAGLCRAVAAEPGWCQPVPRGPRAVPQNSPQRVSTRILPWALDCRHLPASGQGVSEIHRGPRP